MAPEKRKAGSQSRLLPTLIDESYKTRNVWCSSKHYCWLRRKLVEFVATHWTKRLPSGTLRSPRQACALQAPVKLNIFNLSRRLLCVIFL